MRGASRPDAYASLLELSGAAEDADASTLLDGWNLLPHHPAVGTAAGMRATRRVTLALAASRGMLAPPRPLAAVAAFLLAVMGLEREEGAFWTLAALVRHRLPPRFFDADMAGADVEAGVLDGLLAEQCPSLWDRLLEDGDGLGAAPRLSAEWVGSLLLKALPPDTAARVFDCLLCEGVKVVHRVALALCTLHTSATLTCVGTRATRAVLDWRTRHCFDADALLRMAFRSWPGRAGGVRGWIASLTGSGGDRGHLQPLVGAADDDAASSLAGTSLCSPRGPLADDLSCTHGSPSLDSWEGAPAARAASPGRRTQTAALRLLLSRPAVVAKAAIHSTVH
ncbi:hypothetical protein QBZ16_004438 [Prototheca wickerhamii]|uniref:Rab-GAP TBC domain-containing protein n=1 Tax=Prototheca wickerhamii TaxID=3111 RepID=A0AAD9IHC4_PROWI|nr:hypothetical protein QBZ16_004438 [Prototheca wickerhamii]